MSFITIEHTFAAWVEKEWAALYKAQPKIDQIAAATLKYAGPALQLVVSAEAGAPAGAIVGKVVADAQAGLAAASGLVYDFGPTPTASGMIAGVSANLSQLLAAGHITNPKSVSTIQKVQGELSALSSAIVQAAPAPSTTQGTGTAGTQSPATGTGPAAPANWPAANGAPAASGAATT